MMDEAVTEVVRHAANGNSFAMALLTVAAIVGTLYASVGLADTVLRFVKSRKDTDGSAAAEVQLTAIMRRLDKNLEKDEKMVKSIEKNTGGIDAVSRDVRMVKSKLDEVGATVHAMSTTLALVKQRIDDLAPSRPKE